MKNVGGRVNDFAELGCTDVDVTYVLLHMWGKLLKLHKRSKAGFTIIPIVHDYVKKTPKQSTIEKDSKPNL